ncbi:OmpH family outer membrane protein [Dysgonomonas sp. 511]|uniref:OmpH family outer membrane protein n=1 Tax=Dysgonomonas sp. 511 TaxID=2302930 RepID=UPI0013D6883C|nr:OmpH family outer membrane protein [Dysgonomonas sp. 511]
MKQKILFAIILLSTLSIKAQEKLPTEALPIAFVDVDSVLVYYNLVKDVNQRLATESRILQQAIDTKQAQHDSDIDNFTKRINSNDFASAERAQLEYERIQKQEKSIEDLKNAHQNKQVNQKAELFNRVNDSLLVNLKEYNKAADYQVIFTNKGMDNILLAKDQYNITDKIIRQMNSRYKKELPE